MAAGLEIAGRKGYRSFFVSLTVQYDPSLPQTKQSYSLAQLTLAYEAFARKLRRAGFRFEYARVSEATNAGIVNHFHTIFRCETVPEGWLVNTRIGVGLDWAKLRAVWVDASKGSQGVWVTPIAVERQDARASALWYISKYLTKQSREESKMYWSTSRGWLPKGAPAKVFVMHNGAEPSKKV